MSQRLRVHAALALRAGGLAAGASGPAPARIGVLGAGGDAPATLHAPGPGQAVSH